MNSDRRPAAPTAVIDTNTVLDWLLFDEPSAAPIAAAVETGTLRWLACNSMRTECEHVLSRSEIARWQPDPARVAQAWDRFAAMRPTPTPGPTWPRCTDPDDQVFIDLAIAERATWLVTRDRALLKLRRRAAHFGVQVVRPPEWRLLPAG
ncbi:PIN domain-containing protein [Rivibacter subsaxonicus]|uniref:Putative PIN family toxin of toxin-antitoxin system n=1 Tax=Rivibacter subsaxonicus TaxID=457575 RepID=A0A4Q7V5T9_9BURK|nr:PIN domain-containing protein [Rivibacter subsaxonicus]RZT91921.1 putative PIN family toxin of toxin-antitoxin system [Rivibacter subsaxonicus]